MKEKQIKRNYHSRKSTKQKLQPPPLWWEQRWTAKLQVSGRYGGTHPVCIPVCTSSTLSAPLSIILRSSPKSRIHRGSLNTCNLPVCRPKWKSWPRLWSCWNVLTITEQVAWLLTMAQSDLLILESAVKCSPGRKIPSRTSEMTRSKSCKQRYVKIQNHAMDGNEFIKCL